MASTSNQETFKAEGMSGRVVYDVLRQVGSHCLVQHTYRLARLPVAAPTALEQYVCGGEECVHLLCVGTTAYCRL